MHKRKDYSGAPGPKTSACGQSVAYRDCHFNWRHVDCPECLRTRAQTTNMLKAEISSVVEWAVLEMNDPNGKFELSDLLGRLRKLSAI